LIISIKPKAKESLDVKGEQIEREIARSILENNYIKTLRETNNIYYYENGVFVKDVNNTHVREWIDYYSEQYQIEKYDNRSNRTIILPYKITTQSRNNILEITRVQTFCNYNDFDAKPNRINVRNGHLILNEDNEWEFTKHFEYNQNPYLSFIQFPIDYDPEAENLEIDQLLTDIFGFDTVPLIYQMIAYFYMANVKYGKAFMLYGETGTGKTTFLNILYQIIGTKNISGLSLIEIQRKFGKANLRRKVLNLYDDLPNKPLYYNNEFRQIVTNSRLSCEIKNVQDFVDWNNRTKLIYSCNQLPPIKKDSNDAFYGRWVLIRCSNEVRNLDTYSEDYRDKKWDNKELSGLLNKILQAYITLEKNKGFPKKWDNREYVRSIWDIEQNPVALFITEKCDIGDKSYQVEKQLFLNELNAFRKTHNGKPIAMNYCTRKLREIDDRINIVKITERSKHYNEKRLSERDYRYIQLIEDHEYLTTTELESTNPIIDNYIEKRDKELEQI